MRRLDAWNEVAGAGTAPLFQPLDKAGKPRGSLSVRSIRNIVARRVADAGIEGRVSGHSLRVGPAQSLVRAGASMAELKQAGRRQSERMPSHYSREERARSGAVARYGAYIDGLTARFHHQIPTDFICCRDRERLILTLDDSLTIQADRVVTA